MRMRNTFVITVMILASTCLPLGAVELGPVNVHGTVSQGYIDSSGNNFIEDSADGTLDFREYGINASLMLGERVTLGGQMFGREFGSVGNDDIYLDWLVAEYAWRDWLGCSVGKLKVPYGFYGKTRDIDSLRTGILLPQGVYMEYIRSSYNSAWSGSVDGYVPRAGFGGISYSLQCGVRDMDEDNGEMSRLLTGQNLDVNDIKEKTAAAAALTWHTPLEGLRVGGTWSWSEFSLIGSADSVTKEHDQDDWFISIRFDITENLILKAEEHFVFGTAGVFEHENPDGVDDDWSMTLVKLSYVF